mmetsp:Transcript_62785/g.123983  ORF Transcript_62785/g.123983 Transcript_62785/m.123983 type:complete len:132 (+) Transcript_62785:136-531(+)
MYSTCACHVTDTCDMHMYMCSFVSDWTTPQPRMMLISTLQKLRSVGSRRPLMVLLSCLDLDSRDRRAVLERRSPSCHVYRTPLFRAIISARRSAAIRSSVDGWVEKSRVAFSHIPRSPLVFSGTALSPLLM